MYIYTYKNIYIYFIVRADLLCSNALAPLCVSLELACRTCSGSQPRRRPPSALLLPLSSFFLFLSFSPPFSPFLSRSLSVSLSLPLSLVLDPIPHLLIRVLAPASIWFFCTCTPSRGGPV